MTFCVEKICTLKRLGGNFECTSDYWTPAPACTIAALGCYTFWRGFNLIFKLLSRHLNTSPLSISRGDSTILEKMTLGHVLRE